MRQFCCFPEMAHDLVSLKSWEISPATLGYQLGHNVIGPALDRAGLLGFGIIPR